MIITAVRYRKLKSGPGYTNEAIEAEATVGPGENPDDALLALGHWVNAKLNSTMTFDIETMKQEVAFYDRQRHQLRGAVGGQETRLQKLKEEIAAASERLQELTRQMGEARQQQLLKVVGGRECGAE
jgi:hypothetical protein